MTLNKFLCKYFDKQNSGIVTVWDVISPLALIFIILYSILQGILNVHYIALNGCLDRGTDVLSEINQLLGVVIMAVCFVSVLFGAFGFIRLIFDSKIAKCDAIDDGLKQLKKK